MTDYKTKILELLQTNEKGINVKEIISFLGPDTKKQSIYTTIYFLRKKYKIIIVKDKYILKQSKVPAIISNKTPIKNTEASKINDIYKIDIDSISSICSSDLPDYLELIKKSIFYKLSSDALLQANKAVENIKLHLKV